MTTQIDQQKLENLIKHIEQGGSVALKDMREFLGESPKLYKEALLETHPHFFDAPAKPLQVNLITENGLVEELEVKSIKDNQIYVERKVPKDLVTLKIRGKDETVDVLVLKKMKPTDKMFDTTVQNLLVMAEVARG